MIHHNKSRNSNSNECVCCCIRGVRRNIPPLLYQHHQILQNDHHSISYQISNITTHTKTTIATNFLLLIVLLVSSSLSSSFLLSEALVLPTSSSSASSALPPPAILQQLLQSKMDNKNNNNDDNNNNIPILLPCCYDGLTARLVGRHRNNNNNNKNQNSDDTTITTTTITTNRAFQATFMSGFGVSAIHGIPDTQLISYQEMIQSCTIVSEALQSIAIEYNDPYPLPCIADGDTGYGNAMNVQRTVFGYGRCNMAGIMIEDQISPKRCGHVHGKRIVSYNDAVNRIRAACDARDAYTKQYGPGTGPLILARTDACTAITNHDDITGITNVGFDEAMKRCNIFRDIGADITFLEAPESIEQMIEYCNTISGPKLANMLEYGTTPILSPQELYSIGYTMAAYPLTLLSSSIMAMQSSLDRIMTGQSTNDIITTFTETKDVVGFTQYNKDEMKYK